MNTNHGARSMFVHMLCGGIMQPCNENCNMRAFRMWLSDWAPSHRHKALLLTSQLASIDGTVIRQTRFCDRRYLPLDSTDTDMDIEKQEQGANSIHHTTGNPNSRICDPAQNCCTFSWRNISYSIETPAGKKQILTNIDGCAEKGYRLLSFSPTPSSLNINHVANDRDTACSHGPLWLW